MAKGVNPVLCFCGEVFSYFDWYLEADLEVLREAVVGTLSLGRCGGEGVFTALLAISEKEG